MNEIRRLIRDSVPKILSPADSTKTVQRTTVLESNDVEWQVNETTKRVFNEYKLVVEKINNLMNFVYGNQRINVWDIGVYSAEDILDTKRLFTINDANVKVFKTGDIKPELYNKTLYTNINTFQGNTYIYSDKFDRNSVSTVVIGGSFFTFTSVSGKSKTLIEDFNTAIRSFQYKDQLESVHQYIIDTFEVLKLVGYLPKKLFNKTEGSEGYTYTQKRYKYYEEYVAYYNGLPSYNNDRIAVTSLYNIYKRNTVTGATKDGNVYWDLKLQPEVSNNNVNIPKIGSDCFIMKTSNESGFIVRCDEYDTTPLKVDNYLSFDIKKYLSEFKADSFTLNVGNDTPDRDKKDINIYFNRLECNKIDGIVMTTPNTEIRLKEKDLSIKGDRVGIGIVGSSEYSSTEFDDDFEAINKEFNTVTALIEEYAQLYNEKGAGTVGLSNPNNIKVETNSNGEKKMQAVVVGLLKDVVDIGSFSKYEVTDFASDKVSIFNKMNSVRTYIREGKEPIWDTLTNEFGAELVGFCMRNMIVRVYNNKQYRRTLSSLNRNEGIDVYYKFLSTTDAYKKSILDGVRPYLLKSNNRTQDIDRRINDEIPTFGARISAYVSPEDAYQIVFNYLLCRLAIVTAYKVNINKKYEEARRVKEVVPFDDSFGLILKEMLDAFSGAANSYTTNTAIPPTPIYIMQPPASLNVLKTNIDLIKSDIDALLY